MRAAPNDESVTNKLYTLPYPQVLRIAAELRAQEAATRLQALEEMNVQLQQQLDCAKVRAAPHPPADADCRCLL